MADGHPLSATESYTSALLVQQGIAGLYAMLQQVVDKNFTRRLTQC
jgi:hypothetical protein